jgi:drug/metabolite transporter (DMT)-like permease
LILGVFLGLVTAVVWGTGDFLSRKPSERLGSFLTSVYVQAVGLGLLLIFSTAIAFPNYSLLLKSPSVLALNLLAGFVALFGLLALFEGYARGVMSIVAPIANAYPALTLVLSVLFLGTRMNKLEAVAIGVIIAGTIIAGIKPRELASGSSNRRRFIIGVDYGFVALVCSGVVLFAFIIISPVFGTILSTSVLRIASTATGFSLVVLLKKKLLAPTKTVLAWLLIVSACDTSGFLAYSYGVLYAGKDLPIVVTLAGLTGAITMLLARLFYKERLEKLRLLGVFAILAGVAAVLYF